jgi:hypothetical protein
MIQEATQVREDIGRLATIVGSVLNQVLGLAPSERAFVLVGVMSGT